MIRHTLGLLFAQGRNKTRMSHWQFVHGSLTGSPPEKKLIVGALPFGMGTVHKRPGMEL